MDKYFTDRHNQRWTSDKEARLIGLYEENRLLWDSRHPDYRDKDKRERAMSAIAEGLQDEFDVLNVKNKIKWLRDYFVKELKRELGLTVKTTSHQGTPSQGYVSRWEHFNKWAFLRSIFSADLCSPSTTNAPDSPTPTNEKEHADAVPAVGTPSAEEKKGHDSPASDAETGPRNESGCATIGDVSVDSFSLYVIWQLRQMNQYQRDLAILRIRQQLFDAKYAVEPSIPAVGAATLLGGAWTSRHSQPASTTRDSRAACVCSAAPVAHSCWGC
ncbi:uncharacterized protein [Dermacentor albipictus]|uniref:uncharacterized protein isoform X2 n=1 Tax=Dermacentor albipictus TaxID=60249 RepID=UPI0031FD1960